MEGQRLIRQSFVGVIIKWNDQRRIWGFIECVELEGRDVFFHSNELIGPPSDFWLGTEVRFTIGTRKNKDIALNVSRTMPPVISWGSSGPTGTLEALAPGGASDGVAQGQAMDLPITSWGSSRTAPGGASDGGALGQAKDLPINDPRTGIPFIAGSVRRRTRGPARVLLVTLGLKHVGKYPDDAREVIDEAVASAVERHSGWRTDVITNCLLFDDPASRKYKFHSGHHGGIIERVLGHPRFREWLIDFQSAFPELPPRRLEDPPIVVALFCKSGIHRAVACATILQYIFAHNYNCMEPPKVLHISLQCNPRRVCHCDDCLSGPGRIRSNFIDAKEVYQIWLEY